MWFNETKKEKIQNLLFHMDANMATKPTDKRPMMPKDVNKLMTFMRSRDWLEEKSFIKQLSQTHIKPEPQPVNQPCLIL